ncbi:MAG TPA: pyrroloquinoline quinone biosynthesis peptide chaperone PqqD, partial [Gemmataceae bacterium]
MPGDESDEILGPQVQPCLARKARLVKDRVSGAPLLLYPEGVLWLNTTADAIIGLCDGRRALSEIVTELGGRYAVPSEVLRGEVDEFLDRLYQCGLLCVDRPSRDRKGAREIDRFAQNDQSLSLP